MSLHTRWATPVSIATLALTFAACRAEIEVRTMAAPDAVLSTLHTFRILPAPARRDGQPATGTDDPMISNSIANRAIRSQIVKAFQDRGYTLDERNADFGVAFYASAREKLDVSVWDYGYPLDPRWPDYSAPLQTATWYTEGSAVIDVVKTRTRDLLWRGEGKAELSRKADENMHRLAKTAAAIVAKFPEATRRTIAERQ